MCKLKIQNFEVVEISVNGNTNTFNVPDQPQLRDKLIVAIELLTGEVATASPDTFGTPATIADMQGGFLDLWVGNYKKARRIPLLLLNRVEISGGSTPFVRELTEFQPMVLSWNKCQLVFATPPTVGVVTLGVYYLD